MTTVVFESGGHKNVLLEDYGRGLAVQANQNVIIHEGKAKLLDPGGHKVFNKALAELSSLINISDLTDIFLSHQDPDVVAAINGWLMSTDANAWCPTQWTRFIPHFGLDKLVAHRLSPIEDQGKIHDLNGCPLKILPAHFLHSLGNLQVYDPISKILYSGDLGASLGMGYLEVDNFDSHIQYMEAFHKRYMACNDALRLWAQMVRTLEIDIIAPQHGALFRGKEMVERFISWCEGLQCGIDLMRDVYKVPQA